MPQLTAADRQFLRLLSELTYCNPFQPGRIALEREALGAIHQPESEVAWSRNSSSLESERPNIVLLNERAEAIATQLREAFLEPQSTHTGRNGDSELLTLYEDAVIYVVYYRHFAECVDIERDFHGSRLRQLWQAFESDFNHFFHLPGRPCLTLQAPGHLFACLYQVRRAFIHIFHFILGDSLPAAKFRATVWQSIFTHDMRRYRRTLYALMSEVSTLITGPSGTGKELVGRAIGMSQYISFDVERQTFCEDAADCFLPLNLSALSPTLIESELFGHRKGSFTGAISDRAGWLEQCRPHGAVFLDEIGELDPAIQVKLLRVVQARLYNRLGETTERPFQGKIITATNRDLSAEMQNGRFRMDLYYRLCSDHIITPSLREQLQDRPAALTGLIQFLTKRIAGQEAESVASEVAEWIDKHLPADYAWPGNIRELEQCVRNIMIRRHYEPRTDHTHSQPPHREWLGEAEAGTLTADQLVSRYATWVYAKTGTYEATAKQLQLDRRTVKSKIDEQLLNLIQNTRSDVTNST